MIFIIRHPNAAFRGVCGGISFEHGIGSTNSIQDAERISRTIKGAFASAEAIAAAPTPAPEASAPIPPDQSPAAPAAEKPKRAGGRKPK